MTASETPAETTLFYSKPKSIALMVLGALALAGGLYFYISLKQVAAGIVSSVFGAVIILIGLSKYSNNEPQVIISDQGIQSKKLPLVSWDQISNEQVKRKLIGRVIVTYLLFDGAGSAQKLKVSGLNISKQELEDLLKLYRNRFEQRNKQLI